MKFNIMERKNNAVIPDAMFKLCGMERAGIAKNAKLECNPDEESGEITLREAS